MCYNKSCIRECLKAGSHFGFVKFLYEVRMLIDNISISTRFSESSSSNPHFHNHNEIIFVADGSCVLQAGARIYRLKGGDLIYLKHGVIHKIVEVSGMKERFLLRFPDSVIKDIIEPGKKKSYIRNFDVCCVHTPESTRKNIENRLLRIEYELSNLDDMSGLMIKSYILELMIGIVRARSKQRAELMPENFAASIVIKKAVEFISLNYSRQITLEKTADYVSMSPTYFSKKFKKEIGVGFNEYLRRYRLSEAEKLLKSDFGGSITDIAARCGFNDSNYFATVFRAEYGLSPKKFRQLP